MEDKYNSNVLSGGKLGMVEVPNSRYVPLLHLLALDSCHLGGGGSSLAAATTRALEETRQRTVQLLRLSVILFATTLVLKGMWECCHSPPTLMAVTASTFRWPFAFLTSPG